MLGVHSIPLSPGRQNAAGSRTVVRTEALIKVHELRCCTGLNTTNVSISVSISECAMLLGLC